MNTVTKYSKVHTWLKIQGETGSIGITEFAQSELGEIVFVDLPSAGKIFAKNEIFGSVEAVKTVSDLFMPVGGEIIEINGSLKDNPTIINTDPEGQGWMIRIRLSNAAEVNDLLDADSYRQLTMG